MEVNGICKSYGKKQVLKKISFLTEPGKCIGLIGANGCGKTTLLKLMAGVEKADVGQILIEGKPFAGGEKELRGKIGYVPQENVLMEELSVKDNLKLFATLSGKKIQEEYVRLLCEQFSVTGFMKEKVSRLSGGMKKRVSIVCAMIGRPEILILDEPSAALDLVFKEELKACIRAFTKAGGCVVLSSHDKGEIENCDLLFAMKNGELTAVDKEMSMEAMIEKYIR